MRIGKVFNANKLYKFNISGSFVCKCSSPISTTSTLFIIHSSFSAFERSTTHENLQFDISQPPIPILKHVAMSRSAFTVHIEMMEFVLTFISTLVVKANEFYPDTKRMNSKTDSKTVEIETIFHWSKTTFQSIWTCLRLAVEKNPLSSMASVWKYARTLIWNFNYGSFIWWFNMPMECSMACGGRKKFFILKMKIIFHLEKNPS